jgi:hypothetical protein
LKFKNIILEEKLSNKFKTAMKYFSHVKSPITMKTLTTEKFSCPFLNLLDNFSSREEIIFGKYLVVPFGSHSIRAFSVLLEDSLKIISET